LSDGPPPSPRGLSLRFIPLTFLLPSLLCYTGHAETPLPPRFRPFGRCLSDRGFGDVSHISAGVPVRPVFCLCTLLVVRVYLSLFLGPEAGPIPFLSRSFDHTDLVPPLFAYFVPSSSPAPGCFGPVFLSVFFAPNPIIPFQRKLCRFAPVLLPLSANFLAHPRQPISRDYFVFLAPLATAKDISIPKNKLGEPSFIFSSLCVFPLTCGWSLHLC